MTFQEFIMEARAQGASDIHLTVGAPTVVRINGELQKFRELSDAVVNRTILSILTADQEKLLTEGNDIDFSFELANGARQRVNVFRQSGRLAASIRLLNDRIPAMEELGLPAAVASLADETRGLILVAGPAGSGKSTTIAAMLDHINHSRACHIITVEDPIEYRYAQDKATIHQREIGKDVGSFGGALRSALREDPDVIMLSGIDDYETAELALTAAETGHLVFAALRSSGANKVVERIINVCPRDFEERVRVRLSGAVRGIIFQTLKPTLDGRSRTAAAEVLPGA